MSSDDTDLKESYNAGYSDGWNKCQDQLNDAYRQLVAVRKLAVDRDELSLDLEKKCNEWLVLVRRAHDRLGYLSHDNAEGAAKDIDQVQRGLRAVVEHDDEATAEGANEDWSDEEIDKRIEAKLAIWAWRFSRGLLPHSREGLLAYEALEARKKLAVLLRGERGVNAALERFAATVEASGPPSIRDYAVMVDAIRNRFGEQP